MPAAAALIPAGASIFSSIMGGREQSNAAGQAGSILNNAAQAAAGSVTAEGERGAGQISDAANAAASGVTAASQQAAQGVTQAGVAGQQGIQQGIAGLDPYSEAGRAALQRIQAGLGAGGEFSQQFQFDPNLMNDAGVQYRIEQGRKALTNSALARGGIGGNFATALERQAQGIASEEYNNAFTRGLTAYRTNREAIMNPLQALAQGGQQAAGQQLAGQQASGAMGLQAAQGAGGFLTGGAAQAGQFGLQGATGAAGLRFGANQAANNYRTDAASAQAGARIGQGNARAGMYTGIGQGVAGIDWQRLLGRRSGGTGGAGGMNLAGGGQG